MKRLNDIFKVLLLLSLTSFFVNCTIEDIDDVKSALPYLVIETDSVSFDNVNRYIEIPIKTNRELTIKTSYIDSSDVDSWLEASLSANSDTLRISVAEYNQDIRRRAILTLSSRNDLVDHKITVSQAGSFIPDWKPIDGVYNLSQNGTANCYIVPKSGEYAFYALTKGNSTLPVGDVAAVQALWETVGMTPTSYLITHYSLDDDGYVRFTANGIEGNVLISVKDVSGTILWSWHIWITDQPENHYYTNGASGYYVMDRNLGAIRPNGGTGDQWIESVGTHYQRGRKDPFIMGAYTLASSPYTTVEQSVANPTEFSSRTSNSWLEPWDYSLWSPTGKTMYDPCPVGYRVATKDVYACLKSPKVSTHGVEFCYDGSNTAWYPCTPHTDCYGNYMNDNGNYAYMWVSNATSSHYEVDAIYYDLSSWSSGNIMNSTRSNGDTYPVRCMKDDGNSIPPAPEPAPVETTYTVVGDIEGYSWDPSSPVGLMTKEDKFYVARNIPFKSIEFKIVKTGGWDVVYGVKEGKAYGLNTEIPVSINHSYNICVQAPEGRKYDVYFDLDNEKVWFMEPGKRPGDDITSEKPGGTEGLPDEGYEWE